MTDPQDKSPEPQTESAGQGNGRPPRRTALGVWAAGPDEVPIPNTAELRKHSGVVGSLVVSSDGLILASDLPGNLENVGVWALGVYMNTAHVLKKLGHYRVFQIISKAAKGYLVIAICQAGMLVTVSNEKKSELLIPLMASITSIMGEDA